MDRYPLGDIIMRMRNIQIVNGATIWLFLYMQNGIVHQAVVLPVCDRHGGKHVCRRLEK